MKKKLILFSLLLVIVLELTGCGELYFVIKMTEPTPTGDNAYYENDDFSVLFTTNYWKGITLAITNKTEDTLKINWNEGAFVTPDNIASGIITGETKFIDVGKEMQSTIIPSNSNAVVTVIPKKNVDDTVVNQIDYEIGEINKISLLIPIQIGDKVKEYNFNFEVLIYNK